MAGRAGRPGLGQTGMTRGATVSAALHVVVLLALVLVIPPPAPPPTPPDDAMEVEFEGTAASAQKSQNHGHVAAAAEAEKPATEDPALTAPKPQPLETAPPPPPPPPPPPQAAQSVTQTLTPARLVVPPPDREAEALRPPPPMKVAAAAPPMPTPTPVAPKKPVLQPTDSKPVDSVRHQPNKTKNASPDTHSLLATLEKFSADQKQTAPPTHTYNPSRNGAHDAGGQVHGNLTGDLTQGQRKTIGDSVRRCYSEDTAAKNYATYSAQMEVTIDAAGVVHDVKLAPAALARTNADPAYRAFAERAEAAVMDPQCARLPIPAELLGKPSAKLSFNFRP